MKTIIVGEKQYKVIKKYPHFTLCEDEHGFKICFDDFDLGLIEKKSCIQWRRDLGMSIYKDDKNV